MKAMIDLMKKIFTMPFPWNFWVMILSMINLIGGIMYFSTFEGKFALFSMMGAMIIMTIVYSKYGFVRLLGLGHIVFWLPFLFFCLKQLNNWSTIDANFRVWILIVTIANALSLILDIVDVFRFLNGDKEEMA